MGGFLPSPDSGACPAASRPWKELRPAGVAAKLTLVTNIFRKPWNSNEFGRTVQQALAELCQCMSPSHPFFAEHADDIVADNNNCAVGDAFATFQEVVNSMVTTAGGVRRGGCILRNASLCAPTPS
jgi:hypothetical protein